MHSVVYFKKLKETFLVTVKVLILLSLTSTSLYQKVNSNTVTDISTHSGCRVERCVCDAQKCNQCTGTDAQHEQKREKPHPVPWSGAETPLHHCDLHLFLFLFFLLPSFLGLQLKAECLQAWVQSRLRPADKWVDNTLIVFLGLRVLSGIDLVSRSMHSELRVIFWRTVSKYLFEMQQ